MLRNGAASLHGSTHVQKVCRIHEGRGHLSRRQVTSRAFNARAHSSLYNKYGAGPGALVSAATRPGPTDQARATQAPPRTHSGLPRAPQEPPKTTQAGPRAAKRASRAARRAPRGPQEAPGGLPDPQKTKKNAILSTNFGFWAESDFGAAQRAPRAAREAPRAPQGPPRSRQERPGAAQERPKSRQERPRGLPGGPRGGPGQAQE